MYISYQMPLKGSRTVAISAARFIRSPKTPRSLDYNPPSPPTYICTALSTSSHCRLPHGSDPIFKMHPRCYYIRACLKPSLFTTEYVLGSTYQTGPATSWRRRVKSSHQSHETSLHTRTIVHSQSENIRVWRTRAWDGGPVSTLLPMHVSIVNVPAFMHRTCRTTKSLCLDVEVSGF